ncbi:MAG: glycosyltransferase involved in cell wall biogenesis [Candidatus Peregrinibacteria bacterium GW2011_GWE2_39_6]|nr:MAG: glycosyltransferase involved in cell wall biogenesis [Candidatus Peregrinibacteria bacterium GW2011_GWF2_39_17]KKR26486.1 MAG: glycosyltransferase involved in cell wall biogenesis [Candidatus Peregrinibacteria bacterium GW2011_GWE2_39_6]HCW32584.1 hypothetical protein [Candidatus Peregrinibacteria bacterium]
MKTILVLPAYNEENYIGKLINEAKAYVDEIIVVDDHSSDKTAEKAAQAGAIVLKHLINLKKAAALKTGTEAALERKAEIIIFMDSDGQHLPKDLPRFIQPLIEEGYDIVIGARKGGQTMPLFRRWGNQLLEWAARFLFKIKIKDIQSGYRSFRADCYKYLHWQSNGYHADAEMTIRTGKFHLKFKQIFIETIYHDDFKGMTVVDGLYLLAQIFLWRIKL